MVVPTGSPGCFSRMVLPAGFPGWFSRSEAYIWIWRRARSGWSQYIISHGRFSRLVLTAGSPAGSPGPEHTFGSGNGPGWAGNNVIAIDIIEKLLSHSLLADGPKTYHALLLEFCLRQIMSPLRASLSLALRKCLCFTCPCNWFHNHGEIVEACRV